MYDERYGIENARREAADDDTSLATWFRDLFLHPMLPDGDYFDRLRTDVEASAPICSTCR